MKRFTCAKTLFLSIVLLVTVATYGQAQSLKAKIDAALASSDLKGAKVAVRVVELGRGRALYNRNSRAPLSVASNAKIITTAAALDLLGVDFELSTTLVARGEVRDGTLYGDLVVIGKGDPSISEHFNGADVMAPLRRFAREVAASGIKNVTGDLIADDLYFDRQFLCPSWPPNQWMQWYEAPVGALAFNDNCVDVTIGPGAKAGDAAVIRFYPNVGYVTITNKVTTTSSLAKHRKKGYGFYRGKLDNRVTAKGCYYVKSAPAKTNFTVYDPSLYLITGLKKALSEAGIPVRGRLRRLRLEEAPDIEGAKVIAVNHVTVGEAIKYCNLNSQNLHAEMLFKTLGREVEGEGSFEAGGKAVGRFLEKFGIEPGEYTMVDGSGLSRETKFSAKAITDILAYVYTHKGVKAFRDSLPLAGYTGSLSNRLTKAPYRGSVRAKTGWIMKASALSGYARTQNDKTVAFSMIFNDFSGSNRYTIKPIQDEICRAIVDSSP